MDAVLEQIAKIGIVPVVKLDREEDALPLAKALCAGGLPCGRSRSAPMRRREPSRS